MTIYGDQENSNKFYVLNDEKGLLWVPKLNLAKSYTSDVNCKEWFGKDIYCTSEDIVIGYDNKNYVKSQLPKKPQEEVHKDSIEEFKSQSKKYINNQLELYAKQYGFNSFIEMISWYNSIIPEMKDLAFKGLSYRDVITMYTLEYIKSFNEINDNTYSDYLNNFPKGD